MKKRVGIWIRVSTEDQAQGESPKHHEERAKHYAIAKDWDVVEVYHLEGLSGKSVIDYPETKRMIRDIKSGHIEGLIFSKLARLARNTRELLDFSDLFQKHNAGLVSLQEAIDTSSPAGRLFYTIIAAMAQWEREETSERVAASVPIRANLGKPLGGAAPYGYAWNDDKQMEIDETEAPIRKLMFELFLELKRKKAVAKSLNDAGYRTRNGANFSSTTVGRLLQDPIAKGMRRANYTKSTGKDKAWELKPKEDWVFTPAPRIVSDELWESCNAILDKQEKDNKRLGKRTTNLFSGFAQCYCGEKMYVLSNSPKYVCGKCRNKIGADDLEEIFQSKLKNYVVSEKFILEQLDKFDKAIETKEVLLSTLQKQDKELQIRMDKLVDLYQTDQMPQGGFKKHYDPLFEQQQQVQSQLPEVQLSIDIMKAQLISSDQILNEAKDLYNRWSQLNVSVKRTVIENITDTIIIDKEEITIKLYQISNPRLPFSELVANGSHNDILVLFHVRNENTQQVWKVLQFSILLVWFYNLKVFVFVV